MNAFTSRFSLGGAGPTVAIKDSIDIAGMPTRGGSAALAGAAPAESHADVVEALLAADWHIVGKTNMHELAYGMTGVNRWAGTPVNPQDVRRIPGGSSSGSAVAVGSGAVDVALGSDTGGSIRVPAACCGVIGLKPTFGLVSRRGAWPHESSLDCVGPFARDVAYLSRVMSVIAPQFDLAAANRPLANARIGVVSIDDGVQVAPEVQSALDSALTASGWHTSPCTLVDMTPAFDAGMAIINHETWRAFGHLTGNGKLGEDVERRLMMASATTAAQLQLAEQVRTRFTASVSQALEQFDALLLPTLPVLPPTLAGVAAGASVLTISALVRPFNLSGHPALSFPVAVPGSTLKTGLQLVGRKGDDARLCALALHLQQSLQPEHFKSEHWSS
jgi:amidase